MSSSCSLRRGLTLRLPVIPAQRPCILPRGMDISMLSSSSLNTVLASQRQTRMGNSHYIWQ
ncbi:hypothetical protein FOPG_20158 [Fusarium oxysporum f. sp. conglutinans race 2 54008]|uniref:Uncharacterized protein n=1 Tax=Fusarium oxysporum f. sp. conglutinans race 2 54008 TaxID=1089457 RepID=X0GJT2_FUSOX|nr:hypothetical protein FOPG_20158 [Fusarium oxysporum f. sp. conglutinans race 2 54008]